MRVKGRHLNLNKAAPVSVEDMKEGEMRTTPDGLYVRVGNQVLSKSLPVAGGAPWTVGDPMTIAGTTTQMFATVTALLNGNFMLAYQKDDGDGYVSVYDNTGTIVGSEVKFTTTEDIGNGINIGTLTNGNVVVAFADQTDNGEAKFMILSPTGSTVKAITTASTGPNNNQTQGPPVVPLSNGGFLILYGYGNDEFYAVAYDSAGNETNRPSVYGNFNDYFYPTYFDASPIPGGGALVFYLDNDDYNMGYMVVNASGEVIYHAENITNATYDQDYPSCTVLDNGNYFFIWYEGYDLGENVYAIYNPAGDIVKAITPTISSRTNPYGGAITLSNRTVMAHVYQSNYYGEFYEEDGTFIEEQQLNDPPLTSGAGTSIPFCAQLTGGKIVATIPRGSGDNMQFVLLTGTL